MKGLTEKQSARANQKAIAGNLRSTIRNKFSRFLAAIRKSRLLQPLHKRYGPFKYRHVMPVYRRLTKLLSGDRWRESDGSESYERWARRCELLRYNHNRAIERIKHFTYRPTISIILPVYNPEPAHL